jgi:hypothetical protein
MTLKRIDSEKEDKMDKKVVRSSYESYLSVVARLSAFVTARPFFFTELSVRQDILAAQDLLSFCLHARRLVENAGLRALACNTYMGYSDGGVKSLWEILGYLIHHNEFNIIRCESQFRRLREAEGGVSNRERIENVLKKRSLILRTYDTAYPLQIR